MSFPKAEAWLILAAGHGGHSSDAARFADECLLEHDRRFQGAKITSSVVAVEQVDTGDDPTPVAPVADEDRPTRPIAVSDLAHGDNEDLDEHDET